MLSGDPNCFGHPTKVTFTFSEKCLKNENPNYPPYASYWSATSPYRENSAYNIQTWLSHKMKDQRQKLKLERAVQRAEKKLQIEYDKQMETKKKAADQRFKIWLKSKRFANQSPAMLYRGPLRCPPDPTTSGTMPVSVVDSKRPKTARVRSLETPNAANNQRTKGKLRPRSASASGNRKQITSTLDIKVPKPKPACKALGQDDYMKMRHLAGKRYKKLKDEKTEFQCEDQLLRKLQDLDWEEKCIKQKMVFSEKEDLGKVKAKALKRKKKLKFKGDVITVEVEEMDSNGDVDITFEEVDDKCSDIGCIEKEGVDFHIESRETIDLSDKPDEEFCRPTTAEPPRTECEIATPPTPTPPTRPKTAKQRPADKETVTKKEGAKEADGKKSPVKEKKQAKEEASPKKEVNTLVKGTEKEGKSAAPKVAVSPPKEKSSPPKEKASPKKAASPPKEAANPAVEKEQAKPPKESPAKPKEATSTPKEDTPPQKESAQPPAEKVAQKDDVKSTKDAAKAPTEKVSPPKEAEKLPSEKKLPAKETEKPSVKKTTPNGEVHEDKSSAKEVKPVIDTAVKVASDTFFD